jgi:2-keto-3-deoxy-6-phosphogluconate aldolase
MKLIISGSRDLELCYFEFKPIITNYFPDMLTPSEIVSGTAKGVDSSGEFYASWNHIPVKQFPADWKKYGKAAGPIRNKQMAEYADAAIICINNQSKVL